MTEISPDPNYAAGDLVTFTVDGCGPVLRGFIRGISSKHILTHYIVEISPEHLVYSEKRHRLVYSEEYPFTCLNIQHTFITGKWPS